MLEDSAEGDGDRHWVGIIFQPQPGRSPTSSACEPYREVIELGLSRGRNAMAIWQDLADDHGFTGRYNSVKRFVRKLGGVATPEARVVIETARGQEGQVDYGDGPMVRDPNTGKYRRMRMFVMTLGHSRKSVRFLVFRSSTQVWAEHVQAQWDALRSRFRHRREQLRAACRQTRHCAVRTIAKRAASVMMPRIRNTGGSRTSVFTVATPASLCATRDSGTRVG